MIVGIVLAAGQSLRMGSIKQLLQWGDQSLIRQVVKRVLTSDFDLVRVVLGASAKEIELHLADLAVKLIYNPEYQKGQSWSIKKGLEDLPPDLVGAAFILADQPLIEITTFDRLITVFRAEEPGILVPTYQRQFGNPVFFHQRFFGELLKIQGDTGGREIIRRYPDQVFQLAVDDPGILLDIDQPVDYDNLWRFFKEKEQSNENK